MKFVCKHDAKCTRCGQLEHGETAFDGPLYCVNCKGNHAAYDKACPRWKNEVEIVKVKTTTNVSFPEARKIVEARTVSSQPITGISFSAMARPAAKRSISTQTDIVRCTCQGSADVEDLIEVDPAEVTVSNMEVQTESTRVSSAKPPSPGVKKTGIAASNGGKMRLINPLQINLRLR